MESRTFVDEKLSSVENSMNGPASKKKVRLGMHLGGRENGHAAGSNQIWKGVGRV